MMIQWDPAATQLNEKRNETHTNTQIYIDGVYITPLPGDRLKILCPEKCSTINEIPREIGARFHLCRTHSFVSPFFLSIFLSSARSASSAPRCYEYIHCREARRRYFVQCKLVAVCINRTRLVAVHRASLPHSALALLHTLDPS